MVSLTNLSFGALVVFFGYCMVAARNRRQALALTLAGALAIAVVSPPTAQAQATLLTAIQSVLNVINGMINSALNSVHSIRAGVSSFYQQVAWPVALINEAKALVKQMIGQYRELMQNIFSFNLKSATLPNPRTLENVMRDHQTSDLETVASAYGDTFGSLPAAVGVSPADRAMVDMDDALVVENLKMLKESDAADDLALEAANNIEDGASQAAPGSAPFLTVIAAVASIQSQALTQKMLAAELRQEGGRMAHENALRKRGVAITGDVNTQILNLLKRN